MTPANTGGKVAMSVARLAAIVPRSNFNKLHHPFAPAPPLLNISPRLLSSSLLIETCERCQARSGEEPARFQER